MALVAAVALPILIPLLLGIAGLLAQPACYNGNPPAPSSFPPAPHRTVAAT